MPGDAIEAFRDGKEAVMAVVARCLGGYDADSFTVGDCHIELLNLVFRFWGDVAGYMLLALNNLPPACS